MINELKCHFLHDHEVHDMINSLGQIVAVHASLFLPMITTSSAKNSYKWQSNNLIGRCVGIIATVSAHSSLHNYPNQDASNFVLGLTTELLPIAHVLFTSTMLRHT